MNYFNNNLTQQEVLARVGNIKQVAGAQRFICEEGKGKGTSLIRVRNGNGLDINILPDKSLDIFDACFKGVPLSWISKNGLVSNHTFDDKGTGWLRHFGGGMLVTCGLRNVGQPVDTENEQFGLHGRISSIPAENICVNEYWKDDNFYIEVSGVIRESNVFGENLVCFRTIKLNSLSNEIILSDRIVNEGFRPEPMAILYHFNWGSPLLSAKTELKLKPFETEVRNNNAAISSWNEFQDPKKNFTEIVYLHTLEENKKKKVEYEILNHQLGFGVNVSWDKNQLPFFTQWKMMGESEYVLGLEPGNCFPMGRKNELDKGRMNILQSFDEKNISISIKLFEL
jgi:hypothetical protein